MIIAKVAAAYLTSGVGENRNLQATVLIEFAMTLKCAAFSLLNAKDRSYAFDASPHKIVW